MFGRGLMSLGESDWLASRVDKWVAQCQGYTKLKNRRLSKGCQTMLDRPSPTWGRTTTQEHPNNINITGLTLRDDDTVSDQQQSERNFFQKQLQYDKDISNYIAYLNKPVINMNDHYIEIHQYHYEPQEAPLRPPTRRRKHKIDMKKTEIVKNKGINSTVQSAEYSEFLVKKETDLNRNIRIVSGRSSDEENKTPEEEEEDLDHHRPLRQKTPDKRVDTVVTQEGTVRVKRGQTFSVRSSTPEEIKAPQLPLRKFLSFRTRTTKKNKSGRRKRVVVGEQGLAGPIWPAVLLTFDRSISPALPESPDESHV